jgi:hypothetical protein
LTLADEHGASLLSRQFAERRRALVGLFKRTGKQPQLVISRATTSRAAALKSPRTQTGASITSGRRCASAFNDSSGFARGALS